MRLGSVAAGARRQYAPAAQSGVVIRPLNFTVRRHEGDTTVGLPQYPVKTLSLMQKRTLAGVYLAVLILCASSYYLGWELFGGADRKVLAIVTFVGVVASARYGPALLQEIREYRRRQDGV